MIGLPVAFLPGIADGAPVNQSMDEQPAAAQSGSGYRVFATREGLVGGETSSGHIITPWDYFVALPACTSMSCPWASPGRSGMTVCGSLCYVKVTNPQTGACRTEPILDVGPWFTVDDWWSPENVRFLNQLPSNRQILPQGLPGAQAARDGLNVGYGWGSSDVYTTVGNHAGIDLADGTYWSLDLGGPVGDWVNVEMLWQTGESPSAAAQSCGHALGGGGGAIPRYTPTPAPTVPLTQWGTAVVSGTGGAGLNCRTAPSGSGTVITSFAEGATVTLRGPAAAGWYPVVCAGQAGYASASYLSVTSTPTPTVPGTTTATATATTTTTTTATATATMTGTSTGTVTTTASPTSTPTGTATTTTATPTPTATTTTTQQASPSATATATGPAIWGTGIVSNTGGLGVNCRVSPSTGSGVITVLAEGARVSLTGPASGGWQPVLCSNRQGYVSVAYLNATQNTPTPQPTATRTPTPGATATATTTPTIAITRTPTTTAVTPTVPATSTPIASATASPTVWGTGIVSNTGGLGVNCRVSPSTGSGVITVLAEGARVSLTGPAAGGWLPVLCGGRQGYVSAAYLNATQNTPTPQPTATTTTAPTRTATVPATATATITQTIGSTATTTTTQTATAPTSTAAPTGTAAPANWGTGTVANTGGQGVNCRVGPSTGSAVITALAEGARVQLTGPASNGWQPVLCSNRQGYISAAYLTAVQHTPTPAGAQAAQAQTELASPTAETTVTPNVTPTASEGETATATVTTPNVSPTFETMVPTETIALKPTLAPTEVVTGEPTATPTETIPQEPTPIPTEEITSAAWVVGTGTGLACLTTPSWESDLVIGIPDGTELLRYGDPVDGWQAVLCGETRGYVDASYLSSTPPTPELAPTEAESATVEAGTTETIATEPPVEVMETEVVATEEVTSEPVDVAPETFTLAPVSETSVLRSVPDSPQSGVVGGGLTLGGPEGGVVALTFDASGYADGTVIEATLLITGTGENAGAGGTILALPGVWIDPSSTTITTVDGLGGGSVGWLDVAPGVQAAVDVTGVVSGGTISFVITGTDAPVAIASSTSGSGPLLVITVQAP